MTLESLIKENAAYNLWANTTIVQWLKTHPVALLEETVASSFPSIKMTLVHIWGAEMIWRQRLLGESPATILSQTFQGDAAEAMEGILEMSALFHEYARHLTAEQLNETCSFRLRNGDADALLRVEIIQHCLNHSTYHRGQIVTMARGLGLTDPPSTDFVRYLRSK